MAVVDGEAIPNATFEHWLAISFAHRIVVQFPKGSTKPVVADPPRYAGCIAALGEMEAKPATGGTRKSAAAREASCAQDYLAGKSEAMQFLISAAWLQREAASRGVVVSGHAVREALARKKAEEKPGAFAELVARTGQSMGDMLLRVKIGLLAEKLEQAALAKARTQPSQAEVVRYYGTHRSTYGHPAERDVRIVITKSEAAAVKARREIEAGESYASVARALASLSDLRQDGGVGTKLTYTPQNKQITGPIFAAKDHVLTGPVKTAAGYEVFEVTKILNAEYKPLPKIEWQVRKEMAAEDEAVALKHYHQGLESRWKALTRCRYGYIIGLCGNYKA